MGSTLSMVFMAAERIILLIRLEPVTILEETNSLCVELAAQRFVCDR